MTRSLCCHCHDGCMPPVIARELDSGLWQLYGVSEVQSMGVGKWEKPLLPNPCHEVLALNRMDGKNSYVAFREGSEWGLMELVNDGTIECTPRIVGMPGRLFGGLDTILTDLGISMNGFSAGDVQEED